MDIIDDGKRRCVGYFGKCYGSDDFRVDVGEFGKMAAGKDGLHHTCKSCVVEQHKVEKAFRRWQELDRGMGRAEMESFNKQFPELRKADKARYDGGNVIQLPKREPTFANKVEWKETTSKGRVRDQKVVRNIQGQYEDCCIVGCDYKHYDVAHIWALKHGSDDLPNNCWPMCPNHHREFDKGRLDPIFGDEPGNIKLVHEIDFENVTKALAALNEENSSKQESK